MKRIVAILALQLLSSFSIEAQEPAAREEIKLTISSLKKNVNNLTQGVNRLKQDKLSIEKSLKDMENWGNSEQQAKEFYFNQTVQQGKELLEAEKTIAADKLEIDKINNKYQHTKHILGYVGGALLALLYLKIGAGLVRTFAGPYAIFLSFLGPVGFFTIGYTLVRLFF
jgi:hypothetical protein